MAADEVVALRTADGRPAGAAPRWQVRRDNLWHASTAVLVRHPDATRVYLHRRTATKDVFPDAYDCWAGGVLLAGEVPAQAAARELAEELGIAGVALRELGWLAYSDERTRCHTVAYDTTYDGPVVHQPDEVAWGAWVDLADVAAGAYRPFVPDGWARLERLVLRSSRTSG